MAPARFLAVRPFFASAPRDDRTVLEQIESLNHSLHSLASFHGIEFGAPWASNGSALKPGELKLPLDNDISWIGQLQVHFFPSESVIASTYQDKLVVLTYLLNAEVLKYYYLDLVRLLPNKSYCGSLPIDAPVAYETGNLEKLGYGGGRSGVDFLNELGITVFWVDRQRPGLEASLVYITDGVHSRIIGIDLYDSRVRFALKDLPLGIDRVNGNPPPALVVAQANDFCSP